MECYQLYSLSAMFPFPGRVVSSRPFHRSSPIQGGQPTLSLPLGGQMGDPQNRCKSSPGSPAGKRQHLHKSWIAAIQCHTQLWYSNHWHSLFPPRCVHPSHGRCLVEPFPQNREAKVCFAPKVYQPTQPGPGHLFPNLQQQDHLCKSTDSVQLQEHGEKNRVLQCPSESGEYSKKFSLAYHPQK